MIRFYKCMIVLCILLFILSILIGWGLFPKILNAILKTQVWLKPGSQMREMWSRTPFALDFLIYAFNVTNPEEVLKGGKPILQEVGPYHFDDWKDKYDQIDDEEEDSITFNLRDTFIFRPEKSNGLTGNEILTLPNVLLQSIALVVKRERSAMLGLVSKALKIVFANQSSFTTGTFMELFFNGVFVDCSSHDFNSKALCSSLDDEVRGLVPYNKTHFRFSLFGTKNATNGGRLSVCRGIKNIHKLGKIIRYNDEPETDVWGEGDCNKIKGTDSTIFPPGMDINEGVWAFTPDICRSLGAKYERKSVYDSLPAIRYSLDLGDIKADTHLHCFCPENDPSYCPVKGTMDLSPCMSAPLIVSMPHFYNGDESLFENVEGMRPKKEEHEVFIDFEIISGTPLKAAKRLQFNLDTESVGEIEVMRNLTKMVFPLFWVEEGVQLNRTYVNMLKYRLFLGIKLNAVLRWVTMIGGLLSTAFFALKHTKKRIALNEVKPVAKFVRDRARENDVAVENFHNKNGEIDKENQDKF